MIRRNGSGGLPTKSRGTTDAQWTPASVHTAHRGLSISTSKSNTTNFTMSLISERNLFLRPSQLTKNSVPVPCRATTQKIRSLFIADYFFVIGGKPYREDAECVGMG